jgi:hypothetical protein
LKYFSFRLRCSREIHGSSRWQTQTKRWIFATCVFGGGCEMMFEMLKEKLHRMVPNWALFSHS